jgi:hypothetical protein
MAEVELIDARLFDVLVEKSQLKIEDTHSLNYCRDCSMAMNFDPTTSTWTCEECPIQTHSIGGGNTIGSSSGTIKIARGSKKNYYNGSQDYTKTQRRAILDQLFKNNDLYTGRKIPKDVLVKAAENYNETQQLKIEEIDSDGTTTDKKFVKRGTIKDQILAKWIQIECIRAGTPRRKKDIAEFMRLSSQGFSKGEEILRNLHAQKKINIPIYEEPMEDYTERYLESLGLDNDPKYYDFIIKLVECAIEKRIATSSVLTSKIVGSIWILITHCKLGIDANKVESACDNIRKNTFTRFSKAIEDNILKFVDVFIEYNIPHGIKGKIIKKE